MSQKKRKKSIENQIKKLLILLLFTIVITLANQLISYIQNQNNQNNISQISNANVTGTSINLNDIPPYSTNPYITINNNIPSFTENEHTTKAFETYSNLDSLGRCGITYANICTEIMPAKGEKRTEISMVKPSGWQTTKYKGMVEGNYLYNRCHLIGYQLAGENANEKNLITGTRYFNVTGMLPFENQVADYIKNHEKNHVLYRVTPIFDGNNLVANGVQMEAYSVEDNGNGVEYNVYVYNVQPGITINYLDGTSKLN